MRFVDFLKSTVMLSAAAATALAAIATLAAAYRSQTTLVLGCAGWWVVAMLIGGWLGRRSAPSPAIARLLAAAKPTKTLSEHPPGVILFNRLWPLLLFTVIA